MVVGVRKGASAAAALTSAGYRAPTITGFDQALEDVGILPPPTFGGAEVFTKAQVVDEACAWYRRSGFPYRRLPKHMSMQEINRLANTENDALVHTNMAYHVADTYHPHRFHAAAEGMKSPFDSFNDDKSLRHAIEQEIEKGGQIGDGLLSMMLLTLGTQACANFRPGFACYLYRKYLSRHINERTPVRVLDTSTGYGGRLVGFLASGLATFGSVYVGIDPNTPTHEGNQKLAHDLAPEGAVDLIHSPAEDVSIERVGRASCDFSFTSPPYFRKEIYSHEDTQSWKRYGDDRTGETWKEKFLAPTMALQFACLKPGAYALMNIADVKIRSKVYPLKDWCIEVAERAGFKYLNVESFPLSQRVGANQNGGVAEEPLIIFRRPLDDAKEA